MSLLPVTVTRHIFRAGLLLQKSSPNLMFAGGLAGAVASTVLACRATLKLSDELNNMKGDLEAIRAEVTDENEKRRAIAVAYTANTLTVVKLYAPAVVVGSLSVGALTGSHVVLTRRNAGLTAVAAAVSKSFDDYRERVIEDIGQEKELAIYHAAKADKLALPDGKKLDVVTVDPDKGSPYARFFDQTSKDFQKNPEYNRTFIQVQQEYANSLLQHRGHVFLNEVYDMLGLKRTPQGQVVGWVLGAKGDGYIDFGLFEACNANFNMGNERIPLLDFNVDGVVFDLI